MPFFTLARLRWAVNTSCLLALVLLAGFRAQAQPTTQPTLLRAGDQARDTEYKGPRFPGGPDSLRALLARTLRRASPTLTGQLFLHLSLDEQGVVSHAYLLPPTDPAAAKTARSPAAKKLADELLNKLSVWQLPSPGDKPRPAASSVTLPLYFGPQPGPEPLAYSDENPTFTNMAAKKDSPPVSALHFIQRQFRYPVEDLRNHVEGTAYGYYEISETGAVENRRVVSGLSPTVDAELLRALNTLPDALTPPRQQGRPVRVAYVVPITLKMQ